MRTPPRLQSLVDDGLMDTVVRQLMSGKEATVYVVRCGEETRCAKIYKEATQRSFRQAQEAAWQSAEVDALYRLAAAGVLSNDYKLTGRFAHTAGAVDLRGVLREIDDARAEDAARRLRMQQAAA